MKYPDIFDKLIEIASGFNITPMAETGGFLFCGSQKLTYFCGGKRKYTAYISRISDTKTVMETEISYFRGSENGNCQYNSHGHRKL